MPSDNVQQYVSAVNSHYEKFQDGTVKCIDDEIPFEIPQSWEWTRLGFLFAHNTGKALNSAQHSGTLLPYITTSNLYWDRFELGSNRQMYFTDTEIDKCTVQKGDLLVCEGGDFGRSAIWMNDYSICIQNHIHRLRAFYPTCTRFYYYIFLLYKGIGNIGGKGIGIQGLSSGALHNIIVPLPSFQEQCRIVQVIDNIMPVIEKYEKSQNRLDTLNSEIKEVLRKSILQEAIQGKLIPQDPTDESAEELMKQIKVEKQKLLKEGKLKKKDVVDSIIFKCEDNKYYEKVGGKVLDISDEIPFDIPETWAWIRLGNIVTNEAGLAYSKDCLTDRTHPLIRVLRGGNIEEGSWSVKEDDVIISKKYVKDSLLLKQGTFITPAVTSLERMAKTALIRDDQHNIVVGGFVLMIKPVVTNETLLNYFNMFFQTSYYKKYCISITNKSGQAFYNLSRQKLMQCLVPIPPEKEQVRIVCKYSQLTL